MKNFGATHYDADRLRRLIRVQERAVERARHGRKKAEQELLDSLRLELAQIKNQKHEN